MKENIKKNCLKIKMLKDQNIYSLLHNRNKMKKLMKIWSKK